RGHAAQVRGRAGRRLRHEPHVHRGADRGRGSAGAGPGALRGDRPRGRPRGEHESHGLQAADHARHAARGHDPRPASEPGRALRRQGRRRAAEHRAARGRGQRGGFGHRAARDGAAHYRREDRAGAAGRGMTLRTGLLLLPSRPVPEMAALVARAEALAGIPIYVASQRAAGCRVAGRVADGAIMQGALAEPLVRFLRDTVHGAAREAGRDPARIELVARLNTCIHDDRKAARDVMRPTLVRSLASQRRDFFTFVTAGLTVPGRLAEKLRGLTYTHDVALLRALAPEIPDEFVDACTLTGPPAVVASEVVRLARSGISQVMIYPLAVEGGLE